MEWTGISCDQQEQVINDLDLYVHDNVDNDELSLCYIPLPTEEYNKEYKKIIEIAEKNGYQKQSIDRKIDKFKKQRQLKNTTTLQTNREQNKFHKFTYHPFFMHKFKKNIQEI